VRLLRRESLIPTNLFVESNSTNEFEATAKYKRVKSRFPWKSERIKEKSSERKAISPENNRAVKVHQLMGRMMLHYQQQQISWMHQGCYIMGCDTVWSGRNFPKCRRNVLPRTSGSKNKPSRKPVRSRWQAENFSTLKKEWILSSETLVAFFHITRQHILEDSSLGHQKQQLKNVFILHLRKGKENRPCA
jgi:hypothetical protein